MCIKACTDVVQCNEVSKFNLRNILIFVTLVLNLIYHYETSNIIMKGKYTAVYFDRIGQHLAGIKLFENMESWVT